MDHNPLIAIFGADQTLEDINNPRLLNYKLKSMRYRLSVHHIPDTISWRSGSPIVNTPSRLSVDWTAQCRRQALSWPRLESACMTCPQYTMLHKTVQQGVPDDKAAWDEQIKELYPHRHLHSWICQNAS